MQYLNGNEQSVTNRLERTSQEILRVSEDSLAVCHIWRVRCYQHLTNYGEMLGFWEVRRRDLVCAVSTSLPVIFKAGVLGVSPLPPPRHCLS